MKLYATVTSERASKGQGGNKFVDFMLTGETRRAVLYLKARPVGDYDPDHTIITITCEGKIVFDKIVYTPSKGKQQKGKTKEEQAHESGKCSVHGVRNCIHCHDW